MRDCKNCQLFLTRALEAEAECGNLLRQLKDDGPGTLLSRLKWISSAAERLCGHSPVSCKASEGVLIEALEQTQAEIKELRAAIRDRFKIIQVRPKGAEAVVRCDDRPLPAVSDTILRVLKEKEQRNDE